jgi:LacI family transcriptional regulator
LFEGNFSGQSGILGIETFLMRGVHFSAVFAGNDEMAFGARLALSRRNIRVPEDVSLIGFDDQPLSAFMTPPLTTVAQPAIEMGVAAAQSLVNQLGRRPYQLPELRTQLIKRESVTRVR